MAERKIQKSKPRSASPESLPWIPTDDAEMFGSDHSKTDHSPRRARGGAPDKWSWLLLGTLHGAQIHRLINSSSSKSMGLGTFLITSKASDDCKLSTLCELPLYSGGRQGVTTEAYGGIRRKPALSRRQGKERTQASRRRALDGGSGEAMDVDLIVATLLEWKLDPLDRSGDLTFPRPLLRPNRHLQQDPLHLPTRRRRFYW
jgi:hypothetical protein